MACVVGDGEAETGPLATSWHSNKFLDPARDGAVLPILHLNGCKIANPTVLARIPDDELDALLRGYGYDRCIVSGDDPARCTSSWPPTLDARLAGIRAIQHEARAGAGGAGRDGPGAALADDRAAQPEGLDRPGRGRRAAGGGHLALPSGAAGGRPHQPEHLRQLRGLDALLPAGRAVRRRRPAAAGDRSRFVPGGERRMSANPHANGGLLLCDLMLPDFRDYAVPADPAGRPCRADPGARHVPARRVPRATATANFRVFGPDETDSNRLDAVFEVTGKRGRRRPCPSTSTSPPTAG